MHSTTCDAPSYAQGCRCAFHTEQHALAQRRYRQRKTGTAPQISTTPPPVLRRRLAGELPPHGTKTRYNHRTAPCRCKECKEAYSNYQRFRRYGTVATPNTCKRGHVRDVPRKDRPGQFRCRECDTITRRALATARQTC